MSVNNREFSYVLSYQDVVEIIRLVKESSHCGSIELQFGDLKLAVSRTSIASAGQAGQATPPLPAAKQEAPSQPALRVGPDVEGAELDVITNLAIVRAPMLGTFYRAPIPGEPPFVEVGDEVDASDTVGLIEVMKLFTQVTTGVRGRVVEIPAENATLVEYGQPLVVIEPL